MFEIIFTGNHSDEINLSNNHVLASLHCMNNLLTELDLSENANLN